MVNDNQILIRIIIILISMGLKLLAFKFITSIQQIYSNNIIYAPFFIVLLHLSC